MINPYYMDILTKWISYLDILNCTVHTQVNIPGSNLVHTYMLLPCHRTHSSDGYQCLGLSVNSLRELGGSGGKLFSPLCSIWLPRLSQMSLPCVPQHPVFFSAGTSPIYYHFLPTCLIKIMDWLFLFITVSPSSEITQHTERYATKK